MAPPNPRALKALRALEQALQYQHTGRHHDAERLFASLVRENTTYFDALFFYGLFKFRQQKLPEARELFTKAVDANPRSVHALNHLGFVLFGLGRDMEGVDALQRALALEPGNADTLYNLGRAFYNLKRFDEALPYFDRSVTARPNYLPAVYSRALVLYELRQYEQALAALDRALTLQPNDTDVLNSRGLVLRQLKRHAEALADFDRALAATPHHPELLRNRGQLLRPMGRAEEALASFDRALAIRPQDADMRNSRALALFDLQRYDAALSELDQALAISPQNADVAVNRGNVLLQMRRFDEAIAAWQQVLAREPTLASARIGEAACRLLTGDFRRGWELYEARWEIEPQKSHKPNFSQPMWRGEDLSGKTILLHGEGGYGDTIQFCRYVPLVAARGGRVVLRVLKPLQDLLGSLAGVSQLVANSDPLPDFDLHCPLGSLPRTFGTELGSIPSDVPYLPVPAESRAKWAERLGPKNRLRVGINWAGNPAYHHDAARSIGLAPLLPLLQVQGVEFFSLQKGLRPGDGDLLRRHPQISHLGDDTDTFDDTAAVIAALDLTISSDTAFAHLAGALGKAVWVPLCHVPEWRWLLDREDTPWYPTMRLFRQTTVGDWSHVVQRIRTALESVAG
jgi:tetratricopeptide (TPR) repeat protein